ncbi:hypothetical protein HAX54_037616 [Datura stramonium]|uniref:Uncharacterized protein n=1 Tax=Datura stramonium TaxID=4076 RepID=A0ABS8VJQ3_DATST|nr:hypothetical protein [Datura stramonium]
MCGGQDDHCYDCVYASYPPPTPYYDDSIFSCEINRNNEPINGGMKELKDMLKCLMEKYDEKKLLLERQEASICNLEAQLSQLVQALTTQHINTVDSSQEELEFEEELKEHEKRKYLKDAKASEIVRTKCGVLTQEIMPGRNLSTS